MAQRFLFHERDGAETFFGEKYSQVLVARTNQNVVEKEVAVGTLHSPQKSLLPHLADKY